jgi:hypothetical protein
VLGCWAARVVSSCCGGVVLPWGRVGVVLAVVVVVVLSSALVVAAVRSEVWGRSAQGWHPGGGGQETWAGRQGTWELDMGSFYCRGLRIKCAAKVAGRACPSQPSGLHAALPRPIRGRCRRFAREWALRSLSSFHDDATASHNLSACTHSLSLSLSFTLTGTLALTLTLFHCTLHPAPYIYALHRLRAFNSRPRLPAARGLHGRTLRWVRFSDSPPAHPLARVG